MNRILFEADEAADGGVVIRRGDARYSHIASVLKLTRGDHCRAGIIDGCLCTAVITDVSSSAITAVLRDRQPAVSLHPVYAIVGFPRPIQLKRILRGLTELGVSGIMLVGTELGEKSYLQSSLTSPQNMRKFLIESTAQAGQARLPQVFVYPSLSAFFLKGSSLLDTPQRLLFDIAPRAASLDTAAIHPDTPLWFAVGSERGWTARERGIFSKEGFSVFRLGSRILRTETAAVSGAAILLEKMKRL